MENSLIEAIADREHEQWVGWMNYLFSKCVEERRSDEKGEFKTGNLIIPKNLIERWKRQCKTPYSDLTEEEKKSDITEAKKVLEILNHNTLIELSPPHKQLIKSLMPFFGANETEVLAHIIISWTTSTPPLTRIQEINEKYLKSCGETPASTIKPEVEEKNEAPITVPTTTPDSFAFRGPRETPFLCDSITPVIHGKTTYYLNDGMMRIERQGYPCATHAHVSDMLYLYEHQKDVRKLLKNIDHNRRPIITGFLKDVPMGSLCPKEPEEKKTCREDCANKNTNHCSFCTNLSRYEKNGMKPKTKALRQMVIKMGIGAETT